MNDKQLEVITRHWSVLGTIKRPGSAYIQNVHVGVEAYTMEAALETVRKIHPSIVFMSCQHRGNIHAKENIIPAQQ